MSNLIYPLQRFLSFGTPPAEHRATLPSEARSLPCARCPQEGSADTALLARLGPAGRPAPAMGEQNSLADGSAWLGSNLLHLTSCSCAQARACATGTTKHIAAHLPKEQHALIGLGQAINITNLCDFCPEMQVFQKPAMQNSVRRERELHVLCVCYPSEGIHMMTRLFLHREA